MHSNNGNSSSGRMSGRRMSLYLCLCFLSQWRHIWPARMLWPTCQTGLTATRPHTKPYPLLSSP